MLSMDDEAKMRGRLCGLYVVLLSLATLTAAQDKLSFRIRVSDETGRPRPAVCELVGEGASKSHRADATGDGLCVFQLVPAGEYHARVVSVGFRPAEVAVHISGTSLAEQRIVLQLYGVSTTVQVAASTAEIEPGNSEQVPQWQLQQRPSTHPARQLIDIVRQQPGWLLESNAVLHPRGSEYETQYIVDGAPVYENRSPAFAPPLDLSMIDTLDVQTGGYPASVGRKLGGVVEVHTTNQLARGWHGAAEAEGGSFNSQRVAFQTGLATDKSSFQGDLSAARTERFLDPPAIENFTNRGYTEGLGLGASHDISQNKRIRLTFRKAHSHFDVPNEIEQENSGQRQNNSLGETSGQAWYQQVLSPNWVFDVHGAAHDLSASLNSNPLSTPIIPLQNRGLNEVYASTSIAGHQNRHDVSAGVDYVRTALRENFQYTITDPSAFDPGVLPAFSFAQHAAGNEASWYVQDRISAGSFVVNAGLRWDYYQLLVTETAFSPRVAAAYNVKPLGLVLRASFDRVFQTPATENLLLASSAAARQVTPADLGLPVRPAHGNFYEVGASKKFGQTSIDIRAFRRDYRNFADDDVFLNTGISFPISFSSALIEGIEAVVGLQIASKLVVNANFSNLSGKAQLPVVGGLFLSGGPDLLTSNAVFRISQDQRSTASFNSRYQATTRVWLGLSGWYGSGLPTEIDEGSTQTTDVRILERVDFNRNRLKPSYALGFTGGALFWRHEAQAAEVQATIDNVTDHLNVVNFAGLFSGTALAPPRAYSLRLRYKF